MSYVEELGVAAKAAERELLNFGTKEKNAALRAVAKKIVEETETILDENKRDLANAEVNGIPPTMRDRLALTEARIGAMSEGVLEVAALADPIGEVIGGGELANGLKIVKKRVPLGVVGIIFESRPNVTVDAAALCLKSGNVCVLRGGSDAIYSNKCLTRIMREAIAEAGLPADAIQLVADTSRLVANELMKADRYIDVLIPRGGGGLIRSVRESATIPVIQTGEGNCSVYVDRFADVDLAVEIVDNAKTQRPSVCNAIENVLVHKDVAEAFFSALHKKWGDRVKIVGDEATAKYIPVERTATDEDYRREFLDYIIASRVVSSADEAIEHINRYGTRHSECIVTVHLPTAERFQRLVDAAAVYVNASTRFTDGFEFGLGAEIGISTQKLHARGPMGLSELTTYKYLINGNGQIRE
ncbi:MAG: glutamate-5-semialdehyde dehydrogenase [Bacteroides sp.]|nr:glutamate-5-semialdehyde dehydrogenase [Eubacterium sp.]MCM1419275.1 glutamate-5-semialdehyde dehydrogenase [Roseburia sp.]MCM1463137.1 glutamate-5-semialdehyde dehydrogenase [Bacteroides sp.]